MAGMTTFYVNLPLYGFKHTSFKTLNTDKYSFAFINQSVCKYRLLNKLKNLINCFNKLSQFSSISI